MTHARLRDGYDALLLDLDGTLYRGPEVVAGGPEALSGGDQHLVYVTNNASRSPALVAEHLAELGYSATVDQVLTSAQAAAKLLAEKLDPGAEVVVIGTEDLVAEVRNVGLNPVRETTPATQAVAQGHSIVTTWENLAQGAFAIRAGALWVAANRDATLPTERGLAPGNGSMVAALVAATGAEPLVVGKPEAALYVGAVEQVGAQRPLAVGDRLDTDIAGANRAGMDVLMVLTGVSTCVDVLRADAPLPTFIADSLDALNHPADGSRVGPHPGWQVDIEDSLAVLRGDGTGTAIGALNATVAVVRAQEAVTAVSAGNDAARVAISQWYGADKSFADGRLVFG